MTGRPRSSRGPSSTAGIGDALLIRVMRAIAACSPTARAAIEHAPDLCRKALAVGASATSATDWFLAEIAHYINAGDTILHVAAAAFDLDTARLLLAQGADVSARNRLGTQALHYACDGGPDLPTWNPAGQARMVGLLLAAGADPHSTDKRGVLALHRAVRTRCTGAVRELLARGADPSRPNGSGTTPLQLALSTTGRGGSGSVASKREQQQIIVLLKEHGDS